MNIKTEDNFIRLAPDHPWSKQLIDVSFAHGVIATGPHLIFRDWLQQNSQPANLQNDDRFGFRVA